MLPSQVIGMLQQVMQDTLPDAVELVTPPLRATGSTDVQAPGTPLAAAAAAASASLAGGQPRPPYTLREGVGMRRLVKFRVQAGVQLLLVEAASEVYAQHYHHMAVSGASALTGCYALNIGAHETSCGMLLLCVGLRCLLFPKRRYHRPAH
jgi:hypothetical protein